MRPLTRGASPKKPTIAVRKPRIPAENMLTSISKPAGMRGWTASSNFFISHAASGAMIIAPMNMCTWPRPENVLESLPAATH